jgi:hypothetical protein
MKSSTLVRESVTHEELCTHRMGVATMSPR